MGARPLSQSCDLVSVNHQALIDKNREDIMALAKKYGAYNIRVCGPVARGEDTSSSDIDLLVEMEQGRSLLSVGTFLMELQELLGCRVDILTEKGLKNRIRERVLKEAIPI